MTGARRGALLGVLAALLLTAPAAAQNPTPIHDVQGPGPSSPIVGATVTVPGIVTAVTSDGFFLQGPDALVDADPATSEGVFVFTGAAAGASVGCQCRVTGTVTEFVPTSDPLQPPETRITAPTAIVSVGAPQPLPALVPLSAAFPSPSGPFDQLERVEGMRVRVDSLTVTAPGEGTIDEASATATRDRGVPRRRHRRAASVPRARHPCPRCAAERLDPTHPALRRQRADVARGQRRRRPAQS